MRQLRLLRGRLIAGGYILAALLALVMIAQEVSGCEGSQTGSTDPASPPAASGESGDGGVAAPATTGEQAETAGAFDPARLGTTERDIIYGEAGGVQLKMDIYYPQTMNGPAPAVIYVHGGGWTGGDKADGNISRAAGALTGAGFLVVSVNYRLAPAAKFPAQIEDVKCAVRYLKANAARYRLDPERIGAWGGSAGGHLVSLLGVTDGDEGLEGSSGYPEQSSRVAAVADMFGPSDLTREFRGGARGNALGLQVFGTNDSDSEVLKQASPVTYVSVDDPPFLIMQGEEDLLVPPEQSQELYDRLRAASVPATLVMVKNAGHAFEPVGGQISPTRAEISAIILEFFQLAA